MLALLRLAAWGERRAQALRERTDLTVYLQGEETLAQLIQHFRDERDRLVGTMSLSMAGRRCCRGRVPPRRYRQRSPSRAPRRSGLARPINGRGAPRRNGFMSVSLTTPAPS